MNTIIDKKWFRTDVFEPVTEFPDDYTVWPIGRQNFPYERCIPLAKKDGANKYEWQRNIDLTSLKYIMVETEELALQILDKAIRNGVNRERFYEIVHQ